MLGPQWSVKGDQIIFGIGHFGAFFNGFHDLFLGKPDRVDGGAQIAMINVDGSGFRELTTGPNNNGFPSMSPDATRVVYRTFGPAGEGLRILNVSTTSAVTTLTDGYDNFPLWSPRGDLIMFSRVEQGDYEIFTIKPDGTGVKRLTRTPGNDAHMGWSPDGEHIVFTSATDGIQGRSDLHERAAALRRAVRDALRRQRRAAAHRQPVGRWHAGLAADAGSPATNGAALICIRMTVSTARCLSKRVRGMEKPTARPHYCPPASHVDVRPFVPACEKLCSASVCWWTTDRNWV